MIAPPLCGDEDCLLAFGASQGVFEDQRSNCTEMGSRQLIQRLAQYSCLISNKSEALAGI